MRSIPKTGRDGHGGRAAGAGDHAMSPETIRTEHNLFSGAGGALRQARDPLPCAPLGAHPHAALRAGRGRRCHRRSHRRNRRAHRHHRARCAQRHQLLLAAAHQAARQISTCRSAPTSPACCAAATRCLRTARSGSASSNKQTTPDGLFSLEEVECIGACCWAPAVQVNYDFHDNLTNEKMDAVLESYRQKASER